MRVALPTKNNMIETPLERASEFTIYEVEIELVTKKEVIPVTHQKLSTWFTDEKIDCVLCNHIDSHMRNLLRVQHIELTYGVSGETDDVMIRYLSGERIGKTDENAYWTQEKES